MDLTLQHHLVRVEWVLTAFPTNMKAAKGLLALFVLVSAALAVIVWKTTKVGRRPRNWPPGPPTLPLIGNLHQIPRHNRHLQFQKWAKEYGPIYSLVLGGRAMVVLSSDQAVKDLLDKRSAIYSSRPDAYIPQDIASDGLRPLFMEYGKTWRMVRKLAHSVLNVQVARTYVPYQDLEVKAMLMGLLENPGDFVNHIRRYTMSLTTQLTFGHRTPTSADPMLLEVFDLTYAVKQAAAILDVYPMTRNLPNRLFPITQLGKEYHKREHALFMKLFLRARSQLQRGTAMPCCCIDLLRLQKEQGFSDDIACYMSGSLLQAGSETTAAILIGFVQAMVVFPEMAAKAQAEIDRVCGDRLPDLNDFPDLPYIRGCVKESLRWMPAVTLGVPHAVTQDDTYLNYHIPKGSAVVINVWGIQNDPARHPDPRRFDPSRWATDSQNSAEAANNPDVSQRDHFAFGAGRRICQGMHIADRSLFLAISRTLWAFDFKRTVGGRTGKEIVPDTDDLVDGLFTYPTPFKCNIVPRSSYKDLLVRKEWEAATGLLDENLQWKTAPEGLVWRDYEPQ
ncbi:cytochrome P450 [Apiospora rasikravindrae]|uniref:Cytochrome P450 n=1 Tax=Apiospora rasikravindrae TaxID=990691 RepID=A0ABR1S1S5_9PEZI